jgi:peptidoglycan/LPS O-acetylase OafA/YrhL
VAPLITWFIFGIKSFNKRNMVVIGSILLLVFLQEWTGISNGKSVLRYSILGQLQYFLVGIFMVNLYLQQKLQPLKYTRFWDVAATVAIFSMIGFRWVSGYSKTILFIFFLCILFIGAFRSDAFNRFIKRPWIMAIGGMCYSIYLLHLPIAQGAIEVILKINPHAANSVQWFTLYTLFFLACLVVIVPVFYLLIEKPCMDHSWPAKLRNFIRSKTGRGLSLEKQEGSINISDRA